LVRAPRRHELVAGRNRPCERDYHRFEPQAEHGGHPLRERKRHDRDRHHLDGEARAQGYLIGVPQVLRIMIFILESPGAVDRCRRTHLVTDKCNQRTEVNGRKSL
jgi:hypothetical protein